MFNPTTVTKLFVFDRKNIFMQRVCDYVRTGHIFYIEGRTEESKFFQTADKLFANNPIFDDKLKAFRAREFGLPTGRLLIWKPDDGTQLHWILLVHGKLEQLDKNENWRDATKERITLTGYELVRKTREGESKPSWTWRYQIERFEDLRDSMVMAIRSHRDQDLKMNLQKIWGTAGFAGSREQAKKLVALVKAEWKMRRKGEDLPDLPAGFGWIRRKSDKGFFIKRPKLSPVSKKKHDLNTKITDEDVSVFSTFYSQLSVENRGL